MFPPRKRCARINAKNGKLHAHAYHKEPSMHQSYRFLNTGTQPAAMNMAIDEAVLTHHFLGEAPPTLRVFRWSQPSISLGRFHSVERQLLNDICDQQGLAILPRPTGGRAASHRHGVT